MKAGFSVFVVLFVFQILFLSVPAAGEEAGVSFVLDEVSNPEGSSCDSGYVSWDASKDGEIIGSGNCPDDSLSPLIVGAGSSVKGLKCTITELPWSGGPYTGKVSWCGAESEGFVYGKEERLKIMSSDASKPSEGCGAKSCGLVFNKVDCRPDGKCEPYYVVAERCNYQAACCSGKCGQKDCGQWGLNCGSGRKCTSGPDSCKCSDDASCCSGKCGDECAAESCGVDERCALQTDGSCGCTADKTCVSTYMRLSFTLQDGEGFPSKDDYDGYVKAKYPNEGKECMIDWGDGEKEKVLPVMGYAWHAYKSTGLKEAMFKCWDWSGRVGSVSDKIKVNKIISALDWRNVDGINYVTPVKDQGQCGSCWAFATVAVIEAVYKKQTGGEADPDLSEQSLVSCLGFDGCKGKNPSQVLNELVNYKVLDVPDEKCLPYTANGRVCELKPGCPDTYRVISFDNVWGGVNGVKDALIHYGPVIADMQFGTYSSYTNQCNGGDIDHAVAIVGFDDSRGQWIIKNSFGTDFEYGGFYRVNYNSCAIEDGVYAVKEVKKV